VPAVAASTPTATFGVGVTQLQEPAAGGRVIYVSTSGSDTFVRQESWGSVTEKRHSCLASSQPAGPRCPEPSIDAPLRTIQTAVRSARPGDVIAVRAGSYPEAIGWNAKPGTADRPITLQAYPGERVEVRGTLILIQPDWWSVRGLRLIYNAAIQKGQSVVTIEGGDNWSLLNNEISGSVGVANLLIRAGEPAGTSSAARQAAAPNDFVVAGNCIHDNKGRNTHGMDHNIYLMSSTSSRGGLIERNLIFGAPNGANLKAAGASQSGAAASPVNVTVRYNTMLNSATGVVLGLKAQRIEMSRNIIARQVGAQQWDAGVKGWLLASPSRNSVKDSLLTGYRPLTRDVGNLFMARNNTKSTFSYTRSLAGCTAVPSTTAYGHFGK
jgi:hypothetical protein